MWSEPGDYLLRWRKKRSEVSVFNFYFQMLWNAHLQRPYGLFINVVYKCACTNGLLRGLLFSELERPLQRVRAEGGQGRKRSRWAQAKRWAGEGWRRREIKKQKSVTSENMNIILNFSYSTPVHQLQQLYIISSFNTY